MPDLAGRRALIAGARRIGAEVALRIASEGVHVAVSYRRSEEEARHLCERITSCGVSAAPIQADLSIETDVRRAVGEASRHLGGLDFVINLASGYDPAPLETLGGESWDRAMTDARASFLLSACAARVMAGK